MPIADVNHQKIYYEDVGSGPTIVLGHSFLCTGDMWREQVRVLAPKYRVINPDLRGHGQSGPADQPFSIYDAVDDVIALLDHLGIESATWCGLSIGGMVAMRAALVAPERVSALAVLDSSADAETIFRKSKYRAMGLGVRLMGPRPFLTEICKLMFGAETRANNPKLVEEWRETFADVHVPSVLNGLVSLIKRDSISSRLSQIKAPALVMVGEQDRSLPPAVSRRIHDGLANSEYVEVKAAGHLSALEQPDPVNNALEAFLQHRAQV